MQGLLQPRAARELLHKLRGRVDLQEPGRFGVGLQQEAAGMLIQWDGMDLCQHHRQAACPGQGLIRRIQPERAGHEPCQDAGYAQEFAGIVQQ